MGQLLVFLFAVIAFARFGIAFDPPTIPLGWTTAYPCAVDDASRILAKDSGAAAYTDNTPASCIERCDAANYTYAGVEYSGECHCGTGLVSIPQAAPTTDCNMTCTGNSSLSCGGAWRIQIYKSLALAPGEWAPQGCFLDTPLMPAFSAPVHTALASNLSLVHQCVDYCTHIGMPFSGVENASDCQCSLGLAAGAIALPDGVCNCAAVETLMVYKYQE
ncbi:hypothetical protein GSI_01357 [Ganoderma sinense ZZ0214-1]|uniref:WSC domain-containing protein n=1 Tax=Ganoderma sinense ZZ0214-1 TaxID=1077348 RepID=A0A2G8SVB6_9APHY|nr:hypothetical protein GSI_01357 [Ganoderma sinense ZZ0214-1]